MSQLYEDFVDYLVGVLGADADTEYVDDLLATARASIAAGSGSVSSLTSSGLNGKSFSRLVHLSPIDVARACQEALKIHAGESTEISVTQADFRNFQR